MSTEFVQTQFVDMSRNEVRFYTSSSIQYMRVHMRLAERSVLQLAV